MTANRRVNHLRGRWPGLLSAYPRVIALTPTFGEAAITP
jgi:hypothetical protein